MLVILSLQFAVFYGLPRRRVDRGQPQSVHLQPMLTGKCWPYYR
jgi:hypothetical protein